MKLIYTLLIGLLLGAIGACSSSKEVKEKKKQTPAFEEGSDNSLLWQITGNGMKDTSYIFGTMHLIDKEYFYFPDKLKDLIKSMDLIVLEIGEEMNDPFKAMSLMQLEEGKSLFDFFDEAQEDTIITWVNEKLGMNEAQFRAGFGNMKPFILVALGSELDMAKNAESYEKTILAIQSENEIPLEGLETLEDQIGVFDDFTDEEQTKMVMEAIRNGGESKETMQKLMKMYRRQNIDSLHIMIQEEGETMADKEDELLSNRNHNWIPKINKIVPGKKVFIAVGAGHLGGQEGVLQLLRNEGYTVTPLKL